MARSIRYGSSGSPFAHLCGWKKENAVQARKAFASSLKVFADLAPSTDYKGNRRMLWEFTRKALGKDTPNYAQEIGDCFIDGTMVRMANGSEKPIEAVQVGDIVMTHKGRARKVIRTIVKNYEGELITIRTKSQPRSLTATPDHRMPKMVDSEIVWTPIGSLDLDNPILVELKYTTEEKYEFGFIGIVSEKEISISSSIKVRCLEVEEDHSFIANGYAVHNCVSFGGKNVSEYLSAVEIALHGESEKWHPIFPPYFYGTSRVQIGQRQLGNGDGSTGIWLQEAAKKYGVLAADEEGVPRYSGSLAKKWGYYGPDQQFIPIGQKHLIKTTAMVRTAEEAANAILNGYPCNICSNQGFQMTPSSDGFHRPSGSWGHCVMPGTVIGANKTLLAENVKISDWVIGHDGKHHQITEIFERDYEGDVVSIAAAGIPNLQVTYDHPVLVYRRLPGKVKIIPGKDLKTYGNGANSYLESQVIEWETAQPCWVRAHEIQVGDYLMTPIRSQEFETTLPEWKQGAKQCKNVPNPIEEANSELAWLFGLYIADGCSEKGHRITITLAAHEEDYLVRAKSAFEEILGVNCRISRKETYTRLIVDSSIVADSFREWFGANSHEKHIPEFLHNGWDKAFVIEGILAGGCRKDRRNSITTTSKHLAQQLRGFLIDIGENPSVKVVLRGEGAYANAHEAWAICWTSEVKRSSCTRWGDYFLTPVKGTLLLPYKGKVYNYEVDEVHSYLANGIIVHNCMTLIGFEDHAQYGFYFIILNSWGDVHGQLKDFTTGADLPVGVLRVKASTVDRMLAMEDSFAFSQYDGYPDQAATLDKILFDLVGD